MILKLVEIIILNFKESKMIYSSSQYSQCKQGYQHNSVSAPCSSPCHDSNRSIRKLEGEEPMTWPYFLSMKFKAPFGNPCWKGLFCFKIIFTGIRNEQGLKKCLIFNHITIWTNKSTINTGILRVVVYPPFMRVIHLGLKTYRKE